MLTYEYFCEENQQTLQVRHGMTESLKTWGELCQAAGVDTGETPATTPVERLISGGLMLIANSDSAERSGPPLPMYGSGCCGMPERCGHR